MQQRECSSSENVERYKCALGKLFDSELLVGEVVATVHPPENILDIHFLAVIEFTNGPMMRHNLKNPKHRLDKDLSFYLPRHPP